MRRAQTEPAVFVGVQPREEWINWLDMVIQNRGQGFAYDVRLQVEPDFEYSEGEFLSSLGMFKHGINVLSPQQTIRWFFTNMVEKPEGKFERKFQILVRYRDDSGGTYRKTYHINLRELSGMSQLGTPPLHSIARDMKSIQGDLNKILTGSRWLHLHVHFRSKYARSVSAIMQAKLQSIGNRFRERAARIVRSG